MAASRSSPSSRRARGKSCRSPGGSQPSSLPAHRASRESARTLWHDTRQVPSQRGGASLGRSRQLLANDVSFDHLVGAREQRRRHFEADCFGSVQIDHQFELAGLLNGQLPGLLAFKDAADIDAGLAMCLYEARAITHQATGLWKFANRIERRQSLADRERRQLFAILKK